MVGDLYDGDGEDPAYYPGTIVLINLADLRDQAQLNAYEVEAVGRRSLEPPPPGDFDPPHYCDLHRHLFQDVYAWAGEYRTIWTAKGGNWFCHHDWIDREMAKLFKRLDAEAFHPSSDEGAFIAAAADFLGELNAIHPFREANGRSQLFFLRQLGLRAGHPFRSEAVERDAFLHAMIESYHGRLDALLDELERMLA